MPMFRGGRMLKRWRYVGFFGADIGLWALSARVGPIRHSAYFVWDREGRAAHQATWGHLRAPRWRAVEDPVRRVFLPLDVVHVRDGGVSIDLTLEEDDGIEVVCPTGRAFVWTRKQAARAARGHVEIGGRRRQVAGLAVVDDTAGYQPRHTVWSWSTGVGTTHDGRGVAWNLVEGINDPARESERAVWVDGAPREVGPVRFSEDLSSIEFGEGGQLRCHEEARREHRESALLFRSEHVMPMGRFSGTLPGGLDLAEGYGVMEHHDALW